MAKALTKKLYGKRKKISAAKVRATTHLPKKQEVSITAAKGRPMLTWVAKRPLRHVVAFPAQHVETFDPSGDAAQRGGEIWSEWPDRYPPAGLLFHGDNKEVLAHLLANGFRGKVNLVYIDPPFDSGADYVRRVSLRGAKGIAKLDGEGYTLGEQLQYTDIWANDNYLQFMYERLLLLKELLAEDGSIYLHCDWHRNHQLRCVMDEVFGPERLVNEIVWQRTASHNDPGRYGVIHDVILFYSKGENYTWNDPKVPQSREYIEQFFVYAESPTGEVRRLERDEKCPQGWRRFRLGNFASPHPPPNLMYEYKGYKPPATGWKVSIERMKQMDDQGRLYFPPDKTGRIQPKSYLDEVEAGKAAPDLWIDIMTLQAQSEEREDFPTQKPEALMERIILASSNPGDLVLDCFVGSGTTVTVAQKLGRRWLGCDINKGAIQTTSKRLQTIIEEQIEQAGRGQQVPLAGVAENEATLEPTQLSFAGYRVNDYDLVIQHDEAVDLACDHLGVTPTRTDRYFDGTLGRKLVKVVSFNHPLTLLDLEELKRELEARPEEDRGVVLVCLGKEPAADGWIEDWNRFRKGKAAVNRIEVVELRTDPKYGKFFQHQPAQARVKVVRKKDTITVEIEDFISPTIIERLQEQAGLLKPKIDDWRAMVDCVLIDRDYDGKMFRIGLSDVPERKSDLVAGRYEIPAGRGPGRIAVKVIDMLGEEVFVTLPKS